MGIHGTLRAFYQRLRTYRRFIASEWRISHFAAWRPVKAFCRGFNSDKQQLYPGFGDAARRRDYVADTERLNLRTLNGLSSAFLRKKEVLFSYLHFETGLALPIKQVYLSGDEGPLPRRVLREAVREDGVYLTLPSDDCIRTPAFLDLRAFACLESQATVDGLPGDGRVGRRPVDPGMWSSSESRSLVLERALDQPLADGDEPVACRSEVTVVGNGVARLPAGRSILLRLDGLDGFLESDWLRPTVLSVTSLRGREGGEPFVAFSTLRRAPSPYAAWPRRATGVEVSRVCPESGEITDTVLLAPDGDAVTRACKVPTESILGWEALVPQVVERARMLPNLKAICWHYLLVGEAFHLVDVSNDLGIFYAQLHGPLRLDPRVRKAL